MKELITRHGWLIASALWLAGMLLGPGSAQAQQALPLPDVLIHGTVTRNGEPITAGTVKVVLPRGAITSTDIAAIAGTSYTYALAVPLSMYLPDTGSYLADSALVSETLSFRINDLPATFRDDRGAIRDGFVIPTDGIGQAYIIDLFLSDAGSYPLGDVNASGASNSADALLVLKYDVGLTTGDTTFPPAPGKIYTPLCDIVEDGKCNSSDALRILQCDVQMAGVTCPQQLVVTATEEGKPTADPNAPAFRITVSRGVTPDLVVARILGGDGQATLAAARLDFSYPAEKLTLESCSLASSGLDGGYCNASAGPGQARLSAVATAGLPSDHPLAALTLRALDGVAPLEDADLSAAFGLVVQGAYDGAGQPLGWNVLETTFVPRIETPLRTYLPLALNNVEITSFPVVPIDAAPTEVDQAEKRVYLPLVLSR